MPAAPRAWLAQVCTACALLRRGFVLPAATARACREPPGSSGCASAPRGCHPLPPLLHPHRLTASGRSGGAAGTRAARRPMGYLPVHMRKLHGRWTGIGGACCWARKPAACGEIEGVVSHALAVRTAYMVIAGLISSSWRRARIFSLAGSAMGARSDRRKRPHVLRTEYICRYSVRRSICTGTCTADVGSGPLARSSSAGHPCS